MSDFRVLVILPAEAAACAPAALAAGGTPVIDATCAEVSEVPDGAWVRVRKGQEAPGDGPVVVAGRSRPLKGRETWIEVTEPGPAASPG